MTTASNNSNRRFSQQQQQKPQQQLQQRWQQHIWPLPGTTSPLSWNLLLGSPGGAAGGTATPASPSTKSSGPCSPAEGVKRCCRTLTQRSDCTRSTCLTAALIAAGVENRQMRRLRSQRTLSLRVWKLSFCLAPNNSCKVEKPNNK